MNVVNELRELDLDKLFFGLPRTILTGLSSGSKKGTKDVQNSLDSFLRKEISKGNCDIYVRCMLGLCLHYAVSAIAQQRITGTGCVAVAACLLPIVQRSQSNSQLEEAAERIVSTIAIPTLCGLLSDDEPAVRFASIEALVSVVNTDGIILAQTGALAEVFTACAESALGDSLSTINEAASLLFEQVSSVLLSVSAGDMLPEDQEGVIADAWTRVVVNPQLSWSSRMNLVTLILSLTHTRPSMLKNHLSRLARGVISLQSLADDIEPPLGELLARVRENEVSSESLHQLFPQLFSIALQHSVQGSNSGTHEKIRQTAIAWLIQYLKRLPEAPECLPQATKLALLGNFSVAKVVTEACASISPCDDWNRICQATMAEVDAVPNGPTTLRVLSALLELPGMFEAADRSAIDSLFTSLVKGDAADVPIAATALMTSLRRDNSGFIMARLLSELCSHPEALLRSDEALLHYLCKGTSQQEDSFAFTLLHGVVGLEPPNPLLLRSLTVAIFCSPDIGAAHPSVANFLRGNEEILPKIRQVDPVSALVFLLGTRRYSEMYQTLIAMAAEPQWCNENGGCTFALLDLIPRIIETPAFAPIRLDLVIPETSTDLSKCLRAVLALMPVCDASRALAERLHICCS